MNEPTTVDELLAQIIAITAQIEAADPDTAHYERLQDRREELRTAAQRAGDAARSDAGLLNELGTLERRLEEIDDRPIGKSFMEKTNYRYYNDPGAYSSQINRMINQQDETERESITQRIAEIKLEIKDRSTGEGDSEGT